MHRWVTEQERERKREGGREGEREIIKRTVFTSDYFREQRLREELSRIFCPKISTVHAKN